VSPNTIVVALGGNALSPTGGPHVTVAEQFRHTRSSMDLLVNLVQEGWRIAIVHGNGPQVGDELTRNELAIGEVPALPLGVLVAETAGWIGYMIQQSLGNALAVSGVSRDVITVLTQTVVDANDPRLERATKPVGHTLSDRAKDELLKRGAPVGKDGAGRWRRMAPSPVPLRIVEIDAVRELVGEGKVVIAAGGGGPPVIEVEKGFEGIEALVDKDRTAAVLAEALGADTLLILTNVSAVFDGWGSEDQKPLNKLTTSQVKSMLERGGLGEGSMAPKLEAAVSFVERGGRRAVIAHLEEGVRALAGETGTTIMEKF